MNIEATGFKIGMSEQEIWTLVFALKHSLEASGKVEHCASHDGMQTFYKNYSDETVMYETLCGCIRRLDLFRESMKEIEKNIEERTNERVKR